MIKVDNASFAYKTQPVINEVSMEIIKGEILGIIGPNGSGKSTLLKLLNGILKPKIGEISFYGSALENIKRKELARSMAWVPQESQLIFPFKVMEIVMMGRHPYLNPLVFEGENDRRIVHDAFSKTGTESFINRLFNEISVGEKQRVMIASAIAQEPEIMLLDEPTSSLDIKYQIEILNILKQLNLKGGLTLVLAMHDLHLASKYCNRLILLDGGRIVKDGPPNHVLEKDVLETVYGVKVKILRDKDDDSLIIYPQ